MKVNKNLPNYLCIIRIVLIPFILFFLLDNCLVNGIPVYIRMLISGALFGIAMLTDMADGKIARRYNLVSDFGKFLDPIADKLLVVSVLMGFISVGLASSVAVILIVAREFLISGLRMQAAAKGEVIAASIWGKIKTATQGVVMSCSYIYLIVMYWLKDTSATMLTSPHGGVSFLPVQIAVWVLALITVISVIPYFVNGAKFIKMK